MLLGVALLHRLVNPTLRRFAVPHLRCRTCGWVWLLVQHRRSREHSASQREEVNLHVYTMSTFADLAAAAAEGAVTPLTSWMAAAQAKLKDSRAASAKMYNIVLHHAPAISPSPRVGKPATTAETDAIFRFLSAWSSASETHPLSKRPRSTLTHGMHEGHAAQRLATSTEAPRLAVFFEATSARC